MSDSVKYFSIFSAFRFSIGTLEPGQGTGRTTKTPHLRLVKHLNKLLGYRSGQPTGPGYSKFSNTIQVRLYQIEAKI